MIYYNKGSVSINEVDCLMRRSKIRKVEINPNRGRRPGPFTLMTAIQNREVIMAGSEERATTTIRLPEKKIRILNSIIALKRERLSAVIEKLVDGYIEENKQFYLDRMSDFLDKPRNDKKDAGGNEG